MESWNLATLMPFYFSSPRIYLIQSRGVSFAPDVISASFKAHDFSPSDQEGRGRVVPVGAPASRRRWATGLDRAGPKQTTAWPPNVLQILLSKSTSKPLWKWYRMHLVDNTHFVCTAAKRNEADFNIGCSLPRRWIPFKRPCIKFYWDPDFFLDWHERLATLHSFWISRKQLLSIRRNFF